MINNLSIAVHAFARRISTFLSVDEALLPNRANFSTNFRGSPLRVDMAPSRLKHSALSNQQGLICHKTQSTNQLDHFSFCFLVKLVILISPISAVVVPVANELV